MPHAAIDPMVACATVFAFQYAKQSAARRGYDLIYMIIAMSSDMHVHTIQGAHGK